MMPMHLETNTNFHSSFAVHRVLFGSTAVQSPKCRCNDDEEEGNKLFKYLLVSFFFFMCASLKAFSFGDLLSVECRTFMHSSNHEILSFSQMNDLRRNFFPSLFRCFSFRFSFFTHKNNETKSFSFSLCDAQKNERNDACTRTSIRQRIEYKRKHSMKWIFFESSFSLCFYSLSIAHFQRIPITFATQRRPILFHFVFFFFHFICRHWNILLPFSIATNSIFAKMK